MKRINFFWYTSLVSLAILLFTYGCNTKESPIKVPLEKPIVFSEETDLEKEIKRIYDKYGVIIEYEWNRNAFARDAIADPADVRDVLPYVEMLDLLYFQALDKVTGSENFSKKETPRTIFLIGSGINYGGLSTFGESSAGQAGNIQPNRLTLGGLSEFGRLIRTATDNDFLSHIYEVHNGTFPSEAGMVGFIYHEYTHFMDRKHDIPKGFEEPASEQYIRGTNAYTSLTDSIARVRGFMLPYGMQNEAEDFATYVQIIVWKNRMEIETTNTYLRSDATREKYKLVYEHYKALGLDLFELRNHLHSDEVRGKVLAIKAKYRQ